MYLNLSQKILLNTKNLVGWRTNRKIVIISVDDYGNVRLDSKPARERIIKKGGKLSGRFDTFDTLETRDDLHALYEVLMSVKDKNESYAVLSPFVVPCNINFEGMADTGYSGYIYELLPFTFKK